MHWNKNKFKLGKWGTGVLGEGFLQATDFVTIQKSREFSCEKV